MNRDRKVDFANIPKTSRLFLDFLHDFSKVQRFFPNPYSLDQFRKETLGSSCQLSHREELCGILERQNRTFGAGERTFEHLQKLRDSDCWAVVTGQQVGLFTGPAYTIYKALTAVKLAAHYACRGLKAVPVFWMATEDHDLVEVSECFLVDADSQPRQIHYSPETTQQRESVGRVAFSEGIQASLAEFLSLLPNSEFKEEFLVRLRMAYSPGKTFASAFGEVFSYLASNYGLILLDPQDEGLKNLARPMLESILLRSQELNTAAESQSQLLLQSGYHSQVILDKESVGLFFEDGGKRRGLIHDGDRIRPKGHEPVLARQDWQRLVQSRPWQFSPNVLFRPVVQDYLLPTLAYVAGPSEIAYLAQTRGLYDELGRKMPIIFPRVSVSIIERKIAKILEKYRLNFEDVFLGSEALIKKIVEQTMDQSLSERFSAIEIDFTKKLGELENSLRSVDPTLGEALKTTQQKVQYQVSHLRAKFVAAETRQQEVTTKQIEKALAVLFPLKTLQERRLNVFYFLSRYGMDFLAQLYEEIDLTDPDHHLMQIG